MNRNIKVLLWVAGFLAVAACGLSVVALNLALTHSNAPKTPAATTSECSNGSPPCIQMIDAKGAEIARFNDFRFCGQGCIWYLSIATGKWTQHTGGYQLNWIGPERKGGAAGRI